MARQLLNHPLSIEFAFRGMMQDMEPDQALEQFLMLHHRHGRRPGSRSGRRLKRGQEPRVCRACRPDTTEEPRREIPLFRSRLSQSGLVTLTLTLSIPTQI